MKIKCEKCNTSHIINEKLLKPDGLIFTCTNCENKFNVNPPSEYQTKNPTDSESTRTLRTTSGRSYEFSNTSELIEFIKKGNASENDMVFTEKKIWRCIKTIPEFKAVLPAASVSASSTKTVMGFAKPMAFTKDKETNTRNSSTPFLPVKNEDQKPEQSDFFKGATIMASGPKDSETSWSSIESTPREKHKPIPEQTQPIAFAKIKESSSKKEPTQKDQTPEQTQQTESKKTQQTAEQTQNAEVFGPVSFTQTKNNSQSDKEKNKKERADTFYGDLKEMPDEGPDFADLPSLQTDGWSTHDSNLQSNEPAWTRTSQKSSTRIPRINENNREKNKTKKTAAWIFILAMAAILSIASFIYFNPDLIKQQVSEVQDSKKELRQKSLLLEATESMLLDTTGDFAQAEKRFLQLLSINPKDEHILAKMSRMYAIWTQYILDHEIDTHTDKAKENQHLQELRDFETKLNEANRFILQAISINPSPEAHLAMADVLRLKNDIEQAKKHLEKSDILKDTQEYAYVNALISLYENKNVLDAISILKASKDSSNYLHYLHRMARFKGNLKKKQESLNIINQILTINPRHAQTIALKDRIKKDLPIVLLSKQNQLEPKKDETKTLPAKASKPLPTKATNNIESTSKKIDTLLQDALNAQRAGHLQEALSLFNQVLEQQPQNIDTLVAVGNIHLRNRSNGAAITTFQRALSINPRFAPALLGIAQAYQGLSLHEEALSWYEKFLQISPTGQDAEKAKQSVSTIKSILTPNTTSTNEQKESSPKEDNPTTIDNSDNTPKDNDKKVEQESFAPTNNERDNLEQ